MAEDPAAGIQLLRSQKVKLIDILSADADFVLQHADSRYLLSRHSYEQVKACRTPSEKVTNLLDHIIRRGPEAAQGLLELLKDQALQDTFPMLRFIKDLQVNTPSSGRTNQHYQQSHYEILLDFYVKYMSFLCLQGKKETPRKRQTAPDLQETIPAKRICNNGESHYTHSYSP